MLADLIKSGFGIAEDYNCAETILAGANQVYHLGLDQNAMKLAAGFGGGMAIEGDCGALTGAIMVLGKLYVKDRAHESDKIKELTKELFERYRREMEETDCAPLKAKYRNDEVKCRLVILKAAEILDEIVAREDLKAVGINGV
jgi:C_GCAxxG_C_C family probable redox protein